MCRLNDSAALQAAVSYATGKDRTPVLRSSVVWEGVDEPLQRVHRRVTVPVRFYDWRGLPEPDRNAELARVVDADLAAGVDLRLPPLLRLAIARLADDDVLLIWTSHHVLLDGWSSGQVFAEVCRDYTAIVSGREPVLAARRPFRDYLQWLREQDHQQAERYWRGVLSGFSAPTPLLRPPAGQGPPGRVERVGAGGAPGRRVSSAAPGRQAERVDGEHRGAGRLGVAALLLQR